MTEQDFSPGPSIVPDRDEQQTTAITDSDGTQKSLPVAKPMWEPHDVPKTLPNDPTGRIRMAREQRRKAEQWVVDCLKEMAPELLQPQKANPPDRAVIESLFAQIATLHGRVRKWRHNFLVRNLNRGARDLGWPEFHQPPRVELYLRGSPLNAVSFPLAASFQRLREAFLDYIAPGSPHHSLPIRSRIVPDVQEVSGGPERANSPTLAEDRAWQLAGEVLLSAVLFGGVGTQLRLLAIATQSLQSNSGLLVGQAMLGLEWNAAEPGATPEWQRWLPDALTAVLLSRACVGNLERLLLERDGNIGASAAWLCMLNVLEQMPIGSDDIPRSLRALFDGFRAWSFRYLPPFIADYATGRLPSVALPPLAWRRLITGKPVTGNPPGQREETAPMPGAASGAPRPRYNRSPSLPADLEETVRQLRRLLRGQLTGVATTITKNAHAIYRALSGFRKDENLPPIVQLLTDWVSARIRPDAPSRIAVSVARSQMESIDRLLVDHIGLDDPTVYDEARLTDVLQSVLATASSGKRHNLRVAALASFHRFLHEQFGAAGVTAHVFDEVPDDGGVDANLFSDEDALAILERLGPTYSRFSPALARAQQVAFLMSCRCGLRRGEIIQLRLSDIQGHSELCLIVTAHRGTTLKSPNAQRVIPMAALLTTNELDMVIAYRDEIRTRVSDEAQRTGRPLREDEVVLFSSVDDPTMPLPEAGFLGPVEQLIREVTGDPTLRLHHGRHSAVTRLLFLLLESVIPDAAELVCKKEGGLNRDVLQQALIGNTSLSGQHLWAVAIFAGHSTPEVTMGNYFHLSDWLLHRALDHLTVGRGQDPLLPLQLVAEDISLSVTVAQNRLRKLGLTESSAFALLLATHRDYVSAWRRPQQTDLPGPSVQGAVAVASSTTFPVVLTQPPGIKNKRGQTMSGLAVLSLLDELDTLYAGNSLMGSKGKVRAARTFEAIINLYDFSAEMANRLWSIVQQLEMIVGQSPSRRSKMQGMHGAVESVEFMGRQLIRPIKRMLLTRSSREAEAVNAACGWLRVAYSRDPESVLDWLALHWRYSDTENRLLRCAEMTPLANWLQIAKPLSEIPSVKECAKGLALTHRANGRPAAGSGKQQRSTWATGLGVVINSIDAGPVLQKPKGEFGIGFIDVSLPLRMAPASGGAEDHGQGKPTTGSPHRKFSLVLDAAAYVVLIDVLMGCN